MDYIGEHLLPGQLGHFFIILSLVASLVATFAYFKATQSKELIDGSYWKKLARYAFITETISVISIFSILFYIISNHYFEYYYAFKHSSLSLEPKYLLACFWEGQEGSFLLWSFWHCIIGLVLMKTGKTWEAPVMTIISFVQVCLATMVAGIYIFGWKMGSNPFILLRDTGYFDPAPVYHIMNDLSQPIRPDYLSMVSDGSDLNPLLQNYWMVIHPPVLFLGFASTVVPYAFVIAGLWKKQYGQWVNQVLPWSLLSIAVLGVGIMMGGAWAYESLNFGGYWAWDPVENASLVPWLIMVAGAHTLLIYKHSGYSLRTTYLFFILSFFFILYSTFLTRSGILGEASVHAFTDLGMNGQLYMLLYLFVWVSAIFMAQTKNHKLLISAIAIILFSLTAFTSITYAGFLSIIIGIGFIIWLIQIQIPTVQKEEAASSREFWMFIGSLVFFLSSIVIISKTSLPVFNKVFGANIAAPEDAEYAYNSIQVYVAIILGVLTAITQYFKYKSTSRSFFWKKIGIPTLISVVVAALVLAFGEINYIKHGPGFLAAIWIATACSIYAIIANAAYIWIGLKGKLNLSGGSIAHFGFGLVLLGILLSSSKKEILSYNTSGIQAPLDEDGKEKSGENLTLVKGLPVKMGDFDVVYETDSAHAKKSLWYYKINFNNPESKEEFNLYPNAFVNYKGNGQLMANPDAKHYWNYDIFTYITSLSDPKHIKDTTSFTPHTVKVGDSVFYSKGFITVENIEQRDSLPEDIFGTDGQLYEATLKVQSQAGTSYIAIPKLAYVKGSYLPITDSTLSESLYMQVEKINPDKTIQLGVKESNAIMSYVTLKAYKFPYINVLWLGIIITALGTIISMVRRIRLNREKALLQVKD